MRVAIYARYSTSLQSAASIEDQIRVCREHAARQGWAVVETYSDAAISGASILRPGLQAAMAAARDGTIDILLAEALDRISRDQEDVAGIYKRLTFSGVTLVTMSEGEVGALHVGLKGTMNALFLKDLADKTRRGMRGKLEKGKAVAGLSYGYSTTAVGERAVNDTEAQIVRRIFQAYADGESPRSIVRKLNAEHITGPRGRLWGPLTLIGNRKLGNGILNNELYIGRMVWNRQRFIKDPDSRKRQARANPRDAWIFIEVPSLRVVDDELWHAVKARQGSLNARTFMRARRPKYLLSGLIKCGSCGGGMSVVGKGWIGCTSARDRGTCSNRRTLKRTDLEARVLSALQHQLMRPELFQEFCAEYTREINRLRMEKTATIRAEEAELAKATRELDKLIDALIQGVPADRVKQRMAELETRRRELQQKSRQTRMPEPYLHPNMADTYRRKVADLARAIASEGGSAKAALETIR
jgi:DNA invertase Pin-like site-specific DNA recombinase